MDTADTITELAAMLAAATDCDTTVEYQGVAYRCRVLPDESTSVFDDDWAGLLAWVTRSPWSAIDDERPIGFNGAARKLRPTMADPIWWQPPADVPADQLDALGRQVVGLIDYGYVGIVVERLDGHDAYFRPIVAEVASLWGIEWNVDDAYAAEVVGELLAELGLSDD